MPFPVFYKPALPGLVLGRLGPGPGLVPVRGPCSVVLGPGPWSWSHGPWSLVPGPWSLAHGPWSLVPVRGPWSLAHGPWSWSLAHGPGPWYMVHGTRGPSEPRVFHQSAPYESYGSIRTTIRRRISIRIILDGSGVKLKPSQHQKLKKSLKVFHRKS